MKTYSNNSSNMTRAMKNKRNSIIINDFYFNTKKQSILSYHCKHIIDIMIGDPSLKGGYVELHQKEVMMTVKSESLIFQDRVMVRVFRSAQNYKVELTSELNVSFLYVMLITQKYLSELVQEGIKNELKWFQDIFSGENKYHFHLQSSQYANLTVFAQQKFKNYELVTLQFALAEQSKVKESVSYRYERMKARQGMLDNYWQNICGVIRTKNPSLLLQLEHRIRKNAFK